MLKNLLCFIKIHRWSYQHDVGRENAFTSPFTGITVWFSEIKIYCGRCNKERPVKNIKDLDLPELIRCKNEKTK